MVLHNQYGRATSGTKFGVTVGMLWLPADGAVRRHFAPGYVLCLTGTPEQLHRGGGASCETPPLSGFAEVSYRDRTWRNGVITLTVNDGRVTEIAWHYPGPFYIDL
jgi:hypothetical protein